jgi:uncharacterized membrane protein YfcA
MTFATTGLLLLAPTGAFGACWGAAVMRRLPSAALVCLLLLLVVVVATLLALPGAAVGAAVMRWCTAHWRVMTRTKSSAASASCDCTSIGTCRRSTPNNGF